MFENHYRIADIDVLVRREEDHPISLFDGFEAEGDPAPQIIFELYEKKKFSRRCYGIEYCKVTEDSPYLMSSQRYPQIRMTAGRTWEKMEIESCEISEEGVMELFLTGFYSYLSLRGSILMHASAVMWNQEAVIFTAASGTGKTTQAELWAKYKKAEILNGDKMFIDARKNPCLAWGSPWRGSSSYALNKQAPLKAVVVLEQAKSNAIRRLEGVEALSRVSPHLFYTSWEAECTGAVMESFSRIMRDVPVYLLSCRPDAEAVEVTCDRIWGAQEK